MGAGRLSVTKSAPHMKVKPLQTKSVITMRRTPIKMLAFLKTTTAIKTMKKTRLNIDNYKFPFAITGKFDTGASEHKQTVQALLEMGINVRD